MAVTPGGSRLNYPAFAAFLEQYSEEVALRRFRQLSIQNLLYYQSELAHLEEELRDIEVLDATPSKKGSEQVTFRWRRVKAFSLQHNSSPVSTPGPVTATELYTEKFLEIRETLRKYNEALDQYLKQEKLASPSQSTLQGLRGWLDRPEFGHGFLSGSVEDVWDSNKGHKPDEFFSVTSHMGLTSGLSRVLINLRRLFTLRRSSTRVYTVDGSSEGIIARGVSVVVASVLPVLPIIILFFVESLLTRIGLILVFTAVFAIVLVFGLKMEPDQVLAITTAIAAIQVVYVGSTANTGNGTT